jgi:hypothetical protein
MCPAIRCFRRRDARLPTRLVPQPPFAYAYVLRTVHAHLRALGAPEPEMRPYDSSKHEPIEEIDIEPDGEQAQ